MYTVELNTESNNKENIAASSTGATRDVFNGITDVIRELIKTERLSAISQIAVTINHEINNSLQAVISNTELLLMKNDRSSDEILERLKTIKRETKRIVKVLRDLAEIKEPRVCNYTDSIKMIDIKDTSAKRLSKILVVDDDEIVRNFLFNILNSLGYSAECARDGEEALRMFGNNRYDLILTDLRMPNMNGEELVRHIRDTDPEFRIFLMTGYYSDVKDKSLQTQVNGILKKPFSTMDLKNMLEKES